MGQIGQNGGFGRPGGAVEKIKDEENPGKQGAVGNKPADSHSQSRGKLAEYQNLFSVPMIGYLPPDDSSQNGENAYERDEQTGLLFIHIQETSEIESQKYSDEIPYAVDNPREEEDVDRGRKVSKALEKQAIPLPVILHYHSDPG